MRNLALILDIVFIISCLILFLYPASAFFRGITRKKKTKLPNDYVAPVSIIIACYNEESFIREKINSFLDPDEWVKGSELIVVSAGSTDGTNKIIEEFCNHPDIQLFIIPERIGKIASVNLAVKNSRNDILVFSDCRQKIRKGSIKCLISNFNDPEVGTVSSTLQDGTENENTSFTRTLLNSIAFNESSSGSSLNLFGALYAQRKSVYRTIPTDILFDDLFVIVSSLTQRKRLIQEKNAIIFDVNFDRYYSKERIERLTRGLLVFLFRHKNLLKKLPAGILLRFLIYKYLKLLLPFLLIGIVGCTLYLIGPLISLKYILIVAAAILLLLSFKKTRELIILFLRVNWFFMTATLKFLFMNERSISWQKLVVDQPK